MRNVYDALMSHDITVIKVDIDGYGNRVDVSTTNEKGFVQYDRTRTVGEDGQVITTDAIAFLDESSSFDPMHDQWDIVDVKNANRMQLKGFEVIDDPRTGETHHYETYLL